jgi:rhodanese-related sulfurtransferase
MRSPGVVGLSPEELEGLLENEAVVLVDVREKVEHWLGSIAGSRLAPLSSRSANAAARISACAGVAVRHLEGGLMAWTASGRAVARFGGGSDGA